MKKYIKPVLEEIKIIDRFQIICATNTEWADGKENKDFWDMDEGDDPWGETPNANKYDLWKD
jgi:hypothetical protein